MAQKLRCPKHGLELDKAVDDEVRAYIETNVIRFCPDVSCFYIYVPEKLPLAKRATFLALARPAVLLVCLQAISRRLYEVRRRTGFGS